ncbi:MAG TPA: GNAT family N-acetyltransferase [Burkholderiaceae bacterium]|nr:GNAT family N-acetyltransferase [Burkholderiaceae bacterium]
MHTLVSARLRLEPLVVAHADALYPILADPRQHEFLDDAGPASLEALRERYRKLESRRSGDGGAWWLNWALVPLTPGRTAIGFVQATVPADHRAWVAYEVGQAWQGQGFGGEATRAMVEHLVAHYRVTTLWASIDARNVRSRRLVERLGFRLAGPDARAGDAQPGDVLYVR